jgi:hypothetical protein
MSSRNFPDFLAAYLGYAKDKWCPEKFHYWSGISIIAAALERKVWMLQSVEPRVIHYPNLYVMLVAAPGDGKSVSATRAIKILKEVTSPEGAINFVPTQITHAALMLALGTTKGFDVGPQRYMQSAAYFFAEEASNALGEIKGGGDIFPLFTQAYDCGDSMTKKTVGRGNETVEFPCMNVLACSTFDHLTGMLTNGGILGGFISRFTFVVSKEKIIRNPRIMDDEEAERPEDPRVALLIQDLQEIFQLTGRFVPDKGYREVFAKFFPENDRRRHAKETEKEQAIVARRGNLVIKLSMILAASESSDMILKQAHWEKAIELANSLEEGYEKIVEISHQSNTQDGLDAAILNHVKQSKNGVLQADLIGAVAKSGKNRGEILKTVQSMIVESDQLLREVRNGKIYLRFPAQG